MIQRSELSERCRDRPARLGCRPFGSALDSHHLPDADILVGTVTVAVEVELTPKHLRRLVDIVAGHSHDHQQTRCYVAPAAERGVCGP